MLLLEHVPNDRVFSPAAWAEVGAALRRLHDHEGEPYGWPVDYQIGTVALDNRQRRDWPGFWGEQRLVATAGVLDRPWRERVGRLAERIGGLAPAAPRPALLHGDLWGGNILVSQGRLAAFIDPACYQGDAEVDLAMLTLFDSPGETFWEAYGPLEPGWQERRPLYQLFPALLHLRLFGDTYAGMVDRLLARLGA
jgi:fructosamine-3-kinase